ncbi:MAG: hypothetical protein ACYDBY_20335 [Thermoanaerobaculia bacterium]
MPPSPHDSLQVPESHIDGPPLEEHLVRPVAGLLHVPHPDFIDAKTRARGQSRG